MNDNQNVEQHPEEDENQVRFDIDKDVLVLPPFPVIGD
jgi:hypothetical protein